MRLSVTRVPCPVRLAAFVFFLLFAPRSTQASSMTLMWDPSRDSSVIGYLVYIGTSPRSYTQVFDVGGATSFVFTTGLAGKTYYFAVASYAIGPIVGPPSSEVSATTDPAATNAAPLLAALGNQTTRVGQSVSFQLKGSDPDGDPLSYIASVLPRGLMLDSRIGLIFGTTTTAGSYSVTAGVTDGELWATRSFAWTVESASLPAATLVSPSGRIGTATPTFVWNAVPNATVYRLWVDDASSGTKRILKDYTARQLGCASGTGRCSINPGVTLAVGGATWWVRASSATITGPWSAGMQFFVPEGALR